MAQKGLITVANLHQPFLQSPVSAKLSAAPGTICPLSYLELLPGTELSKPELKLGQIRRGILYYPNLQPWFLQ